MKIPYELSKNCIVDVDEPEFIPQQQQTCYQYFLRDKPLMHFYSHYPICCGTTTKYLTTTTKSMFSMDTSIKSR